MTTDRKTALTFGILILAGIVFGILSSVPVLETPTYMDDLPSAKIQVLVAILAQGAMAVAYTYIAALLYPKIREYSQGLAIAYFGFRIVGAAFLYVGIASLLLLLLLTQDFAAAGQPDAPYYHVIGELLRVGRDMMNHIGMILPWTLGGLVLCYYMFKTVVVPKWLSVWGGIGLTLTLIATLLIMVDAIKIVAPTYLIMNTPTALFEITLALYLIIKGFRPVNKIAV